MRGFAQLGRALMAIADGDAAALKRALDEGLHPGSKDSSRSSMPLLMHASASAHEGSLACMIELLRAGADPRAASYSSGDNALRQAVQQGSEEKVRLLLEAGDAPCHHPAVLFDKSLAHLAAQCGSSAVLRLLHDHGAPMDLKNGNGWTPLHSAVLHPEACQAMLEIAPHTMNARCRLGHTPLMSAIALDSVKTVELLLSHPVALHVRSKTGATALSLAGAGRDPRILPLLQGVIAARAAHQAIGALRRSAAAGAGCAPD